MTQSSVKLTSWCSPLNSSSDGCSHRLQMELAHSLSHRGNIGFTRDLYTKFSLIASQ